MEKDFLSFIMQSGLVKEDKAIWQNVLEELDEDTIGVLQGVVGTSHEKLLKTTEQLKKEAEAIHNRDLAALDALLMIEP